jgi:hypothetical protein
MTRAIETFNQFVRCVPIVQEEAIVRCGLTVLNDRTGRMTGEDVAAALSDGAIAVSSGAVRIGRGRSNLDPLVLNLMNLRL